MSIRSNMRKILLFIFIILQQSLTMAQYIENFNDGDFTNNPTWTGDAALFKVNTAFQLQLNATAEGTATLSVPLTVIPEMEWSVWVKLAFAPSDNNLARIYLSSDQQDLKGALNGYYIKLGENGSIDAIELVRQTGNINTVVCRGTAAFVAAAFAIKIKVVRTTGGNWKVYADPTGGNAYSLQATGTDNTYQTGSYSGVYCKFTISNKAAFYFDDFYSGEIVVDNKPPEVLSVQMASNNRLTVTFNEPVEASSATSLVNYTVSPGSVSPSSATRDVATPSIVYLDYAQSFIPDVNYLLDIANVKDLAGNSMLPVQKPFSRHEIRPFDVLINEIMADPTPVAGLPDAEYVELYNRSMYPLDLQNWTIYLGNTAKPMPKYILPAGGYVILCSTASKPLLAPYGPILEFSSFTITNLTGTITLKDNGGKVLHAVSYAESWFQGSAKKDGGWSLELIDPLNPCGEASNWMVCNNATGGTPGGINSVNASNPDIVPPAISSIEVKDSTHITVRFTETCDSTDILKITNYSIDKGIGNPLFVTTVSPDFRTASLVLNTPLVSNVPYTLTTTGNITDCAGNILITGSSAQFIFVVDRTPPKLVSVSVEFGKNLVLAFDEPIDAVSSALIANYLLSVGTPALVSAKRDAVDPAAVRLVFSQNFTSDLAYSLSVANVTDLSGNIMVAVQFPFIWHKAKSFEIVINEIMADPTPVVGLPDAEYIELYNRSAFPVDLQNWSLLFGTTAKPLPKYILPAGGYVILCSTASKFFLSQYGPIIDFSSFSVTNISGTLTLKDYSGKIVHTISYVEAWFNSSYKKDGGWSLELVDPLNPCGEASNWKACTNAVGGTPGSINSVNAPNPDLIPPAIARIGITDLTHITVWFSESCDSTNILNTANYTIDNGVGSPVLVASQSPDYRQAKLTLSAPLSEGIIYTLTSTRDIIDCAGNQLLTGTSARFAIPVPVSANDIVINELLYDSPTGCVDFAEIYNRSSKVIDLKEILFVNYDTIAKAPKNFNEISKQPFLMFPGDYYALSTDSANIKAFYKTISPQSFINMSGYPSMNNDNGVVALTTKGGVVIDLVRYSSSMQYPLLKIVDGVSLERISPERPSKEATNWHSASEASGYATPGYKNSQFGIMINDENEIALSPSIFSPDNDGYNDFLTIAYAFGAPGNNITITIYDASGRLVRNLVNHELCGTSGAYTWDGINNDRRKAMIGRYIVFIEIFDMQGKVRQYKRTTVLGGKL